jgi:hypothetical protein
MAGYGVQHYFPKQDKIGTAILHDKKHDLK